MNHRCPQCKSENTIADAEVCDWCGAWIRTSPQPAITYDNILAFIADRCQDSDDSFEAEIESYVDHLRNDLISMACHTTR
jgi:ferredoxin